LYILIFKFFIWDGKAQDFGLNDSKHSLNLIYSSFHHECHSDLLVSSWSVWILSTARWKILDTQNSSLTIDLSEDEDLDDR
jgi:hypothetical protein